MPNRELALPLAEQTGNFLVDGPVAGAGVLATLVLAHGAGAPMDSRFMNALVKYLTAAGIRVVRFEFPYMDRRRQGGGRRPPDPLPVLLQHWRETITRVKAELAGPLLIGGKSMGGRLASMVADSADVDGVCCFGYPFFARGRAAASAAGQAPADARALKRLVHLESLSIPTLILQGTRDPFGRPDTVASLGFSATVRLVWLATGDHELVPTRASGLSQEVLLQRAAGEVASWSRQLFGTVST